MLTLGEAVQPAFDGVPPAAKVAFLIVASVVAFAIAVRGHARRRGTRVRHACAGAIVLAVAFALAVGPGAVAPALVGALLAGGLLLIIPRAF